MDDRKLLVSRLTVVSGLWLRGQCRFRAVPTQGLVHTCDLLPVGPHVKTGEDVCCSSYKNINGWPFWSTRWGVCVCCIPVLLGRSAPAMRGYPGVHSCDASCVLCVLWMGLYVLWSVVFHFGLLGGWALGDLDGWVCLWRRKTGAEARACACGACCNSKHVCLSMSRYWLHLLFLLHHITAHTSFHRKGHKSCQKIFKNWQFQMRQERRK